MDSFIKYCKQYGPWLALLGYYFFWLDRQMQAIIIALDKQNFELEQVRRLLEILAHIR